MRLPIILALLIMLLLPADLRGFATDLQSGFQHAQATTAKLLQQREKTEVAEAEPPAALRGSLIVH